jgi:hypothetical protein
VRGRASVNEKQALVVPRAAVLPEEEKHILFTLKDGKAVEHEVEIGLENDEVVEILGTEIKVGDEVVIEGNYELEPDMAVEIEKPGEEKEKAAPAAGNEKEKEKGKEKGEEKQEAPKAGKKAAGGMPSALFAGQAVSVADNMPTQQRRGHATLAMGPSRPQPTEKAP